MLRSQGFIGDPTLWAQEIFAFENEWADVLQYFNSVPACLYRDQDKKPKGGDTFYEAPEALPSRGSIPSVHAMDPQVFIC